MILLVLGWLTAYIVIGAVLLIALGIWWIIDAFLIPAMIAEQKEEVRRRLTDQALWMNQPAEQVKRTVISAHQENS